MKISSRSTEILFFTITGKSRKVKIINDEVAPPNIWIIKRALSGETSPSKFIPRIIIDSI
ncbi:MAG: hypothetical protein Kow0029_15210 [Candidatus Rifleibacteriota bacterium]